MSYPVAPYINKDISKGIPIGLVIVISVLFHAIILVGLPLLGYLFWKPKKFERPNTFQLVQLPVQPNPPRKVKVPENSPKQKVSKDTPEKSKVPGPTESNKKTDKKPSKDDAARNDEALDELANLLDEIPAPAVVSAIGEFKYPWYLTNVQNKIQKYWNPPSENKNIKVVVAFTIFVDGTISEPVISKSSGDRTLDNLALRAVKLAAPFGKLSAGFNASRVDLSVTLNPTMRM